MYSFNQSRFSLGTVALVLLAAVFGASDQFLGSWSAHPWASYTSLLAAPWLTLPFVVGCTQRTARRAITLAIICTFVALLGYIVMTISPIENAKVSLVGILGLLSGQIRWFLLGAFSSAFFGWLGHRWRTSGKLLGPIIVAATFCIEPFVLNVIGRNLPPNVRWSEVGVGVTMFVFCLISRYVSR
jgi:hypothetical protein